MTRFRTKHAYRAILIHAVRIVVVFLLMLLLRPPAASEHSHPVPPDLNLVQQVLPAVTVVDDMRQPSELWPLLDETDKPHGTAARTLPIADDIVGYRGPSESLIILDTESRILAVRLLHSADTKRYVDAVVADAAWWKQFEGWSWGGPVDPQQIDAVSGATLTSLAVAKGILKRIGSKRPSLLFPDPLKIADVQRWFAGATSVDEANAVSVIRDTMGEELGRVVRTGPFSDDAPGYRGPTELLLNLDSENRIRDIGIRSSFETIPFLDTINQDSNFWAQFHDRSLKELAVHRSTGTDLDGLTGATMTTMAIVDTVVATADRVTTELEAERLRKINDRRLLGMQLSTSDIATIAILLIAGIVSRWHWFQHRRFRRMWLLIVVIVIGGWSGNLLSMALFAGWAQEGIAWQLAPGLAAIAAVAVAVPPMSGANSYCHHLCPHGAVQQLIRPGSESRRHWHLPAWLRHCMRYVPAVTLVAAYLALLFYPRIELSSWEPFDAWLFRYAGVTSVVLAIASLALSTVIPMGYCQLGCPTGSLLEYLRRTSVSDRLNRGDLVTIGLLVFALMFR